MVNWVLSKANSLAGEVGSRFIILDSEMDKVELCKRYAFEPIPSDSKARTCTMLFDLGVRANPM